MVHVHTQTDRMPASDIHENTREEYFYGLIFLKAHFRLTRRGKNARQSIVHYRRITKLYRLIMVVIMVIRLLFGMGRKYALFFATLISATLEKKRIENTTQIRPRSATIRTHDFSATIFGHDIRSATHERTRVFERSRNVVLRLHACTHRYNFEPELTYIYIFFLISDLSTTSFRRYLTGHAL